jgi:hypothetical protein
MDLEYDQSHLIVRDSAERFLRERYDYRTYQKIAGSESGWSAEMWAEFAKLGWLGLPFAEAEGGSGGGAVEIGLLMEAFGKALVVEPYLPTVVWGGGLVADLGTPEQRGEILPALIEGRLRLAVVAGEGAGVGDGAEVEATARGGDYVLSGEVKSVLAAPMADRLLVAAWLPSDTEGVFIVPANAKGLVVRPFRTTDGRRASDVTLSDVHVGKAALLGGREDATAVLAKTLDRVIGAASAEAVGAMAAMVAATVEYAKSRVQFGQPLAKFQVIQHRLVQMKVREEEARASCRLAALSLDGSPAHRMRAVSGAKAKVGRCGRAVAQEAIQLHGAIGTTNELSVGAYGKLILAYEARFGTTRAHLRRYAAAMADADLAGAGLLLDTRS